MNNYELLYWLTRLDNMRAFCGIMLAIGLIVYGATWLIYAMRCNEYPARTEPQKIAFNKKLLWPRIVLVTFIIIGGLGLTFIPTRNEAILILAGGKTLDFVQSDSSIAKIPAQTTKLVSDYMEQAIKELSKENK